MTDVADREATFAALRVSKPIHCAYLDALARRAAAQPEPIRRWLNAKVAAASELAARPPAPATEISRKDSASTLADLLAYIGEHAHEPPQATLSAPQPEALAQDASVARPRPAPELRSVARFHETWSKLSAEQQLTQTLAQAPENAGPMNSQHLVLRSLQLMRDIAPDYLQGFMSYIDTLIWLEHANPSKPASARAAPGERENKARKSKRNATHR